MFEIRCSKLVQNVRCESTLDIDHNCPVDSGISDCPRNESLSIDNQIGVSDNNGQNGNQWK